MNFKEKLEDYTESEFLDFLKNIFYTPENVSNENFEEFVRRHVVHFEKITEHPGQSDVIFYPREGQEDSPEGVLKEVKEWRAANGKSGFKPESD